ncbi:MAG: hypothetical protein J4N64_01530 [Chloroflexi bacterium]|nr:hypothetical protein [Chloroflexota bacterium]MCI0790798.1 hypothetical protein [Chloroflexota bacterium]MCI0840425.1 hypothetical protein [Chloroflexota bacterium]
MPTVTPVDRIRARTVSHYVKRIREHLEAMQRDAHGLEYAPWKKEVDELWKTTFEQINQMAEDPQKQSLEMIKELWTMYISHYASFE